MTQFQPGLVSVTFRKLTPREIVDLVRQAGLTHIEWGGDVHVPPGDVENASAVREMTADAGLSVACYGSYYRVAHSETDGMPFATVLDTAVALGAPTIRVWAGTKDSADASFRYVGQVAADAVRIADMASARGVRVAFEYHGGTIADNAAATNRLLDFARHPSLATLWQPSVGVSPAGRLSALNAVLPRLAHVHVFQWNIHDRLPLAVGEPEWLLYIDALNALEQPVPMLLEFVENDDPAAFLRDAATLLGWLA